MRKIEVNGFLEGDAPVVAHLLKALVGAGVERLTYQQRTGSGLVKVARLEAAQALRARAVAVIGIPANFTFALADGDVADAPAPLDALKSPSRCSVCRCRAWSHAGVVPKSPITADLAG